MKAAGTPTLTRHLLGWARQAGFTEVTPGSSTWCWATPETRDWWGGLWSERIRSSALAAQLLEAGLATQDELAEIGDAWLRWSAADDAWFSVLHGEIIARA